jgi:hypothetical protein
MEVTEPSLNPASNAPSLSPTYDSVEPFIIQNNLKTASISREDYFKLLADCQ